ncbi:helix-turn-helix transcriptional regulator [Aquimarina agarilytica]|uniref:helix-turn-helix transcriptional regulator n=1 Tax=Aquimarina agarilytica TaxID=1087449 RepID=UPI0002889EE1|nr:YafY family protein [Aquimarina agarilytica]
MANDKPRLTRLTAILTQLQSKRIVTARAIAEKHGVSMRTVYRDIRTLEQSGVPIITEEGKGYTIMEGYTLPPVMFTQEEANALLTAEYLIKQNKDASLVHFYESAITKIKATLKYSQKEKTALLANRIQIRNNIEGDKSSNYLIKIQSTIANYQLISIEYVSLKKEYSQREVEAFALYTTQNNWILIAFCRLKNEFRSFRLDCIQSLTILNRHFEPHKITFQQYMEQCKKKWHTPDIPLA